MLDCLRSRGAGADGLRDGDGPMCGDEAETERYAAADGKGDENEDVTMGGKSRCAALGCGSDDAIT